MIYDFANETPEKRNAYIYGDVFAYFAGNETEKTFAQYETRNFLRTLFDGVLTESLLVEITHCDDGVILAQCVEFEEFAYDAREKVARKLLHVFMFTDMKSASEFAQAIIHASITSDLHTL